VGQRDYRLALTSAFDSRERARTAQIQAVDQKIVARGEAERLLTAATTALAQSHARLKTAEAVRPPRPLGGPRRLIGDADRAVQEARTAFAKGDYVSAIRVLKGGNAALADAERDLDAPASTPSYRRR